MAAILILAWLWVNCVPSTYPSTDWWSHSAGIINTLCYKAIHNKETMQFVFSDPRVVPAAQPCRHLAAAAGLQPVATVSGSSSQPSYPLSPPDSAGLFSEGGK